MPTNFELPAGLRGLGQLSGGGGFQLPSGLTNIGRSMQGPILDFQQVAAQTDMIPVDLSGVEPDVSYSNRVEEKLNEWLGGAEPDDPSLHVRGTVKVTPEGIIAEPVSSQKSLDRHEGLYEDTFQEVGKRIISREEAKTKPGYPTFENNDDYRRIPGIEGEPPEEGGFVAGDYSSAYAAPFVNEWTIGDLPGETRWKAPFTNNAAQIVNPIMNNYVNYLEENLTDEELQAIADADIEPLQINQDITSPEGFKQLRQDLQDWMGQINQVIGQGDFSQRYLPSGLQNLGRNMGGSSDEFKLPSGLI